MTDTDNPARLDLLTAVLAGAPVERARLVRVTLAAGQAPGAHHHPCDVVGVVLAGRIRFQLQDAAEVVLEAGDAFFEPRNAHVLRFDNALDDQPASFEPAICSSRGRPS